MDAKVFWQDLPAGVDVTLNIGLGKGGMWQARASIPSRLRIITKLLPTILHPGYLAELVLVPKHTWLGEPMLIVQGTFADDICKHAGLIEGITDAGQDCIAVYRHDRDRGFLYGPNTEAWGDFNINLFHFIGDNHE